MSGFNLPDGVSDSDIDRFHGYVPERVCGTCSHLMDSCCDYAPCSLELDDAAECGEFSGGFSYFKAVKWAMGHMHDCQADACQRWSE